MAERFARGGRLVALGATAAGALGRAPRRGRVRAPGDRRQARAARRSGSPASRRRWPPSSTCSPSPTTSSIAFGEPGDGPQPARRSALARARGCLTVAFARAGRRVGARAARRRPVRAPGAGRDGLPRALGARARVLRPPRPARGPHASSASHDTGASSFLYPFLAEREHDLDAVLDDVARVGADEGRGGRRAARADARARAATRCAPPRRTCAPPSTPAAGCWRSATAARPPTRWTPSPTSRPAARPRLARAPALDLTEDTAILTAIANDIGVEAIFARQVIAYGRARRRAARALHQRQLAARASRRWRRRAGAGCATIALVGYDGGRVAAEGLADHVVVTRSQHIPRIQEAQASAYHVLRELVELAMTAARVRGACEGDGAGRRLPALRLPAGPRAGARAAACSTTSAACCSRSRATADAVERFLGAAARRGAAAGARSSGRVRRRSPPTGERRLRDPRERARRRARRAGHRRRRDLRRLPGRAVRPGRPPPPLPVRQLHQLRPALHDRARRPLRPAADDDGRLRDVRAPAGPSTRTRPTAASTPQPNACPDCGPTVRLGDATGDDATAPGRGGAARRRDRRGQGPRRLPPRLPRRRRGTRSRGCARASTARTSRSR